MTAYEEDQTDQNKQFQLNFSLNILPEQLIRSGNELKAIHSDLRISVLHDQYERLMLGEIDEEELEERDFTCSSNGLTIPSRSSGKGPVFRKSRKRFGPEKLFQKLRFAYS